MNARHFAEDEAWVDSPLLVVQTQIVWRLDFVDGMRSYRFCQNDLVPKIQCMFDEYMTSLT